MAERPPRHLAEPAKRFGLSPLQRLFLVAMLSLAALTAVIALLTRDTGGGRREERTGTPQEQTTPHTPTPNPATTTTSPEMPSCHQRCSHLSPASQYNC